MPLPVRNALLKPMGYQQLSVTAAATALTVPSGTTLAIIRCETQAARWRDDGTAPTATIGMPMAATDPPFIYDGNNLAAIEFISQSGSTPALIDVSYYRDIN